MAITDKYLTGSDIGRIMTNYTGVSNKVFKVSADSNRYIPRKYFEANEADFTGINEVHFFVCHHTGDPLSTSDFYDSSKNILIKDGELYSWRDTAFQTQGFIDADIYIDNTGGLSIDDSSSGADRFGNIFEAGGLYLYPFNREPLNTNSTDYYEMNPKNGLFYSQGQFSLGPYYRGAITLRYHGNMSNSSATDIPIIKMTYTSNNSNSTMYYNYGGAVI